jgi:hypothetical protein
MTFSKTNWRLRLISQILIFALLFCITGDFLYVPDASAQTTAKKTLEKGRKRWENLELDEAVAALSSALELGLKNVKDRIEAHRLLACCHFTRQQETLTKQHFTEILKLKPDYSLPETESPDLIGLLDDARKEAESRKSGEKSKKTLWYILGGAAVIAAGTGVYFLVKGGKKEGTLVIDMPASY